MLARILRSQQPMLSDPETASRPASLSAPTVPLRHSVGTQFRLLGKATTRISQQSHWPMPLPPDAPIARLADKPQPSAPVQFAPALLPPNNAYSLATIGLLETIFAGAAARPNPR